MTGRIPIQSPHLADAEVPLVGVACSDDELAKRVLRSFEAADGVRARMVDRSELAPIDVLVLVEPALERLCTAVLQLRQRGFAKAVLCASQVDHSSAVVEAIAAGADDYVTVPGRLSELPSRAMALARRQSGSWLLVSRDIPPNLVLSEPPSAPLVSPPALTPSAGLLVLDANQRTVSFEGGATVTLTSSEMQILQRLQAQAGTWITAAELMRQVFGYGNHVDNTLVRVHVSSLRKKLADLAWCLESRRTLGYRWRAG